MPLTWRGLPAWLLEERGVTIDGEGLVHIPYRTLDGDLYAERVVAPSGRRWWRPGDGRPVIPFGLDRLEVPRFRRYRGLVVAEGESDALAISAAFGACLDVLGIPGARVWRPEWAPHAAGYAAVYALGDGDDAGGEFTRAILRDVPGAFAIWLDDGLDARDIVQTDPRWFAALLAEAEAMREFLSTSSSGVRRAA
jgi:hypothetical protein